MFTPIVCNVNRSVLYTCLIMHRVSYLEVSANEPSLRLIRAFGATLEASLMDGSIDSDTSGGC